MRLVLPGGLFWVLHRAVDSFWLVSYCQVRPALHCPVFQFLPVALGASSPALLSKCLEVPFSTSSLPRWCVRFPPTRSLVTLSYCCLILSALFLSAPSLSSSSRPLLSPLLPPSLTKKFLCAALLNSTNTPPLLAVIRTWNSRLRILREGILSGILDTLSVDFCSFLSWCIHFLVPLHSSGILDLPGSDANSCFSPLELCGTVLAHFSTNFPPCLCEVDGLHKEP